MLSRLSLATALLASTSAFAAANLSTTWLPPSPSLVYSFATHQVRVTNVGNQNANGVTLAIDLPETNTSPQVFILGELGAFSPACSRVGNNLSCNLGQIKRNKSVTVFFDIALAQSSAPIVLSATAASPNDDTPGNNTANHVANLLNFSVPVAPGPLGLPATNRLCTGTGLTSFFECEQFPGAIQAFSFAFNDDFTLTFPPEAGGYTAQWGHPGGDTERMVIHYYDDLGAYAATFDGYGVSPDCFEGITTFAGGGPYLSPYEICLD